ncbi:GNAT family N-acetyltransferase [Caldifermentibacillus hisashii]|uniref:GNAT family N-acetyltransferase n=1 Tax=Caldifermentibacillus hisashii TaxID=996558 RepID=UPI002E1FEE59|nr:GNAT family N-acetyltransferase [Caldifermentibacillus hisashii]
MFGSKRLYASLIKEDDLEELYQIYISNKDYLQLTEGISDGIGVYTKEQVAEWMGRKTLGIYMRDNMKLIGVLEYMERAVDGNPWIGLIMIHNQYQSQGYGSEFLKSFLCWAQHQGWNEIRAVVITIEL